MSPVGGVGRTKGSRTLRMAPWTPQARCDRDEANEACFGVKVEGSRFHENLRVPFLSHVIGQQPLEVERE